MYKDTRGWCTVKQHVMKTLASVLETKIQILCLNFRFNKEKLHSLVTERCYPVSLSFDDPWDNSVLCFIVLNFLFGCIVFRRWQGVTDTRRSAGGLWSPWSHPEWSMPAALTWSPKATCMGRWRFACTPSRYSIIWVFVCACVCWCFHVCEIVQNSFEQVNILVFCSSLTELCQKDTNHFWDAVNLSSVTTGKTHQRI